MMFMVCISNFFFNVGCQLDFEVFFLTKFLDLLIFFASFKIIFRFDLEFQTKFFD